METLSSRARLRRTFRYPDETSEPEHLDEQEQEALIHQLSAENTLQNTRFARLLLLLPLATSIPYVPHLFHHHAIIAVLSLTSLFSTAFALYKLPPGVTGIAPLDAWTRNEDVVAASKGASKRLRGQTKRIRQGLDSDKSPLEMYLPYLNGVLVVILSFMGMVTAAGKNAGSFAWIGMTNLPGIVYVIVLLAKVVMGGVDPERELARLKYEYRGA